MVFAMSKSNLIAFRIPSELQDEFNRSVLYERPLSVVAIILEGYQKPDNR